jgi:hypothetical protein
MAERVSALHERHAEVCPWVAGIPRFALQPAMT